MQAVVKRKDEIANLQAIQFSKGETSKGGNLPYYSKNSVEIFGKRPGPWTLKDTGDFYKGIVVKDINLKGWTLTSNDSKLALILGHYAKKEFGESSKTEQAKLYIFGLNASTRNGGVENPAFATEIILPALRQTMSEQTGLNF